MFKISAFSYRRELNVARATSQRDSETLDESRMTMIERSREPALARRVELCPFADAVTPAANAKSARTT